MGAESAGCDLCDSVVCLECFAQSYTDGKAVCTHCSSGLLEGAALRALGQSGLDPRSALPLARFLQRNRLENYVVSASVLKELMSINTSKDFLSSNLAMNNEGLKKVVQKCKDAAKKQVFSSKGVLPEELLPLVAAHSRVWHTQGLRSPLLHCTAETAEPCAGKMVDALVDEVLWSHLGFLVCASGHVKFMPELITLTSEELAMNFKPQYEIPRPKDPTPCVANVPAMLDGLRAETDSLLKRLAIAERVFGDRPEKTDEDCPPGRLMLMRLLVDLYVGREGKVDSKYLDRKIARQK